MPFGGKCAIIFLRNAALTGGMAMIGMTRLGPGSAQVTEDGREIGRAEWTMETLAWPGEAVKVARVTALQIREDRRADFWAYLCYLFQKDAAAAANDPDTVAAVERVRL